MAKGDVLGGPDTPVERWLYRAAVDVAPGLVQEGPEKRAAQARGKRIEEESEEFADVPGAGPTVRAGAAVKISPAAKADFIASVIGEGKTKEERIASGRENLFQTSDGELGYFNPKTGQKQLVDQPMTKGQKVLSWATPVAFLAGPLAPLGMVALGAAVEKKYPGTLRETAGDIADVGGAALELAPGIAAELAARRAGVGVGGRLLAQSAADIAAPFIRRGASAALPGQDISMGATAMRGVENAAAGVAGSGVVGAALERPRLPGSSAPPTYMERRAGKALLGAEPTDPTVMAGLRAEEKAGITLSPAALSLNVDAINRGNVLQQSLGAAEETFARELENTAKVTQFAKKRADALISGSAPAEEIGEKVVAVTQAKRKALDTLRKDTYAAGKASIIDQVGSRTIRPRALLAERDELIRRGMLGEGDPLAKIPETEIFETLDRRIQDYTKRAYAGGRTGPDATPDQYIAARLKKAALADMQAGLTPIGPGTIAKDYMALRATYEKMSKPLENFDVDLVADVLSKGSKTKLDFEHIPQALIESKVDRQVKVALDIVDKTNPAVGRLWRRGAVEHLFDKSAATAKSLEGARLAARGKPTGETFSQAGLASKALSENSERLGLILGEGSQIKADLDEVADLFSRIDLTTRGAKGSQTYRMLDMDKKVRSVANVLLHPLKTADELTTVLFKRRMANLLADKEMRNLLIGVNKSIKQNAEARTFATSLQRLGAFIARSEYNDATFNIEEPAE